MEPLCVSRATYLLQIIKTRPVCLVSTPYVPLPRLPGDGESSPPNTPHIHPPRTLYRFLRRVISPVRSPQYS